MIDRNGDDNDADDLALGKPGKQEETAPQAEEGKSESRKPMTSLEATIILARRGNKKVLPMLRRALEEHPELVTHYGSLTLQVQENWLQLVAGKDLLLAETMRRHLDMMRKELAGPCPSPLDRLLVDRILACHVQTLYFEAMETTDPTAENMRVARYRMDRGAQAHRQFLAAVKMLATVRNLVARTSVIQVELLHPPMVQAPVTPILSGTNCAKKESQAESAPSFNGTNRFSRLACTAAPIGIVSES